MQPDLFSNIKEVRYLIIGNGPSRKNIDLNKFIGKNKYKKVVGCNGIWKELPDVDHIICWDDTPIVDMVQHQYLKIYVMGKIMIPNIYEKRSLPSYNSGLYGVKFFSEYITSGHKKYEKHLMLDYENVDKYIDLLGFDCFFENSNGNLCSYLGYGSKEERSPDAGISQQEERVRALFNEFENNPDVNYNIICNGATLSEKTEQKIEYRSLSNVTFERDKVNSIYNKANVLEFEKSKEVQITA